ncbi:M48 family metallopeptidase [Falsarthrobacter nasiphocae]|uniref:Metal-dependent hydrolase n=1 Tax=Falsarthrobacter nasiphocae TaxID=189863 RepID=A0AAE3YG84_9MICC|nr:M48 family metallopeptidase [Falsarthrobacter nasiphocae]MDR6891446.1 putative metal-dependent hydrolase [Falsarthrobacter nasiphocae]
MTPGSFEERVEVRTLAGPREVLVRRSARRVKTVSARWEGEELVILAPARRSRGEGEVFRDLVERLVARRESRSEDDDGLAERARRLIDAHFPGLEPPASVRWVTNQRTRWGSASVQARTIRLSHILAGMPGWVVDAVLVHELAHLIEPNHGPAFRALCRRYPRTDEARVYLSGVEYGLRAGAGGAAD